MIYPPHQKIIFLDFDGPLRSNVKSRKIYPKMVDFLEECYLAGVEIVVSSSWRLAGISYVRNLWADNGLDFDEMRADDWKTTNQLPGGADRTLEILDWVSRYQPAVWAAADDDFLGLPASHYVQFETYMPPTDDHIDSLKDIFGI